MIMKQTVMPLNTSRASERWGLFIEVDLSPQSKVRSPQEEMLFFPAADFGLPTASLKINSLEQSFKNVEQYCEEHAKKNHCSER